jgi:hypothetical protein
MIDPINCPICLDVIEVNRNCVTTECGHCFHTNCLMQNVAHNGFDCPYCRSVMADIPEEDTEYTDYDEDEEEIFQEYILRGFRFFFNNLNGEPHDDHDNSEEDLDVIVPRDNSDDEVTVVETSNVPSINFVAQNLQAQGVTFEQLVSIICHDFYNWEENEELDVLNREIRNKISSIILNYNPQQPVVYELD